MMSGYDPATGICWQFRNKGDCHLHLRCQCPAHASRFGERTLAYFGRCRSGRRWFWSAQTFACEQAAHGFADTEAAAFDDAMAAVRGFRNGQPLIATVYHDWTRRALKDLDKAKWATRPPSDAKDSRTVEYLYSGEWSDDELLDSKRFLSLRRFQITKRTAKRIYYLRKAEPINEHGEPIDYGNIRSTTDWDDNIGFIDRANLEAEGHLYSSHTWHPDWHLHASLAGLLADLRRHEPTETVDLGALKAAMAAAHPDKGGSSAAFIEARAKYVTARRAIRRV